MDIFHIIKINSKPPRVKPIKKTQETIGKTFDNLHYKHDELTSSVKKTRGETEKLSQDSKKGQNIDFSA